ncbi:MAG: hypothetical protein JWM37_759 [Candidatus Saccharibacteria bacterium]|nr:hypothetical protein [Candidatus Saccharibacteria bacterium]
MADNDQDDQNQRSDGQAGVDAVLVEVDFPATRDDLVEAAQDADADETVIVLFQSLPDVEYADRGEVNTAIENR